MKKALLAFVTASSLLLSSVALAATPPALTVSGGNTPYASISVSGSGFEPGETVEVMLGLNSTTTLADQTGAFTGASLTIPNLPAGLYPVIAVGETSGMPAYTYLWVNALYPLAQPSAWYIAPGSALTWSGSGFLPNEQVSIALGTSTVATFSTDGSGAFTNAGASTVPFALRNSTATYTLTSSHSGVHTSYAITVADLYPYANPSSWYALPGTPITFSGAGFGAGEGVSIYLGASTTPFAHVATDSSGAFANAGATTLPYHTASPATYRLVGDASGATVTVPVTLAQFYPSLTPAAYYAAPGSFMSLSGSGFAPNEVVDVSIGSSTPVTATADGSGAFSIASLHMPTVANTPATISAVGEESGATTSFVMAIGAYYSWTTLSTYWAQGGSPLSVFGHNFAGGEQIVISSNGTALGTTTAANDGTFTANVSVPFAPSGPATITATGQQSGASVDSTMTIAPTYTDLELGQYYGAPGSAIEFVGHGYLPNEELSLTTDRTGTTTVATWSADASGNFDYTGYATPADSAEGNLTLTVTSAHSFDSKSIVYYVTGR